ncbi:MAG: hypothetical protein H6722_11875 [Sandaracinus sp.]|nr:hypothetical protein [Sandaracinus sp.]MCB9625063.1 hypothetical protein [Sandaracinus sp.]
MDDDHRAPSVDELHARGRHLRTLWGPNSGGGEELWELDGKRWVLAYGDAAEGPGSAVRPAPSALAKGGAYDPKQE